MQTRSAGRKRNRRLYRTDEKSEKGREEGSSMEGNAIKFPTVNVIETPYPAQRSKGPSDGIERRAHKREMNRCDDETGSDASFKTRLSM